MNPAAHNPKSAPRHDWSPGRAAAVLSVVAVVLMVAAGRLHTGVLHDVVMWDEADYALAAQHGVLANAVDRGNLNAGQRHRHAPLSIYAIRLSTAVFGLHPWSVRLPGIAISVLTVGLVLWIGYDLAQGSRRRRCAVGVIAAALLVTAPAAVLMTTVARPHPFVVFFLLLNIWTLCRYLLVPSVGRAVAFGLSLAGQFVSMEYGPVVVALSLGAVACVRPHRLGLTGQWPFIRFTGRFPWMALHRHVWAALGSCLVGIAALWPAGLYKLGVLMNFAFMVRYGQGGHRALFRGQIYQHVPKYAYAWWYGCEYPLLLVGMVVAMVLMVLWAWRQRGPVAVTLAIFTVGLATAVHGAHIMELCYSLFMIPPVVLGGPLAGAWLLGALETSPSDGRQPTASHDGGWRSGPLVGAGLCVLAVTAVLGGKITPAPPNDQANTKLVAVSRQLAHLAGRGDRVLAQAWPVVRFVLLKEGRSDLVVDPYNPSNYASDDLQHRFDEGQFDWVVTAGSTASAAPHCPLLSQIHKHWTVVAERGSPPREYRLYASPTAGQTASLINDPGGPAAPKPHARRSR